MYLKEVKKTQGGEFICQINRDRQTAVPSWARESMYVRNDVLWFSPFEYFLNGYLVKEIEDASTIYKEKQDARYSPLIQSIYTLLSIVKRPRLGMNSIILFPTNDPLLNDLFTKAENEAQLTADEKNEIEQFRGELYSYKKEFEENIGEESGYDFLKNLFLCEFKNIEIILDNFDKIRPEYIFQHWGTLSLNIINFTYDKLKLMEASANINNSIFNFVKKYGTPILCAKLLENTPQIFQLLTK